MQAIIITSRVSCYREFNNLSDDTKYASIITDIREQLLIKLRFPNFFWGVYNKCSFLLLYPPAGTSAALRSRRRRRRRVTFLCAL